MRDHHFSYPLDGRSRLFGSAACRGVHQPGHANGGRVEPGQERPSCLRTDHAGGDHPVPFADAVASDHVGTHADPAQGAIQQPAQSEYGEPVST